MADLIEYKCPSCGGMLEFDSVVNTEYANIDKNWRKG